MKMKIQKSFTLIEVSVIVLAIGIMSAFIYKITSDSQNLANLTKIKSFSAVLKSSLAENIIGDWSFFEGSGTTVSDLSRYHKDGTLIGGTSWITNPSDNCISDNCLSFDGLDDYVSVVHNLTEGLTAVTVEAWVNGQQVSNIINTDYSVIVLDFRGAGFYLLGEGGVEGTWRPSGYLAWDSLLPYNLWTHVAATWDGNTMSLYVNGLKQSSTLAFTGGDHNKLKMSSTLYIGKLINEFRPWFKGSIDQVRLYDNSIPTSQIKEHYYAGLNKLMATGEISEEEYLQRYGSKDI